MAAVKQAENYDAVETPNMIIFIMIINLSQ